MNIKMQSNRISRYLFTILVLISVVTGCSNEGPPRDNQDETAISEAFLLASSTLTGIATGIYVSDYIAYIVVLGTEDTDPDRLVLFDISDIEFPVFLSEVTSFNSGYHITPHGQFEPAGTVLPAKTSTLFVPALGNGIHIFDVSDSANPTLTMTEPEINGPVIDIALTDTFRCFSESIDLAVLSTPPGGPDTLGTFPTTEGVAAVANDENFCYMIERATSGTNQPQFRIIDPAVPGSPVQVGAINLEGQELIVADDIAYVVTKDVGMSIIDVSTPATPAVVGQVAIPDVPNTLNALSIDNTRKRAYVASEFSVSIIDISDPVAPFIIDSIELLDRPLAITSRNGILYIATFDLTFFNPPQLLIVDVSQF